MLPRRKRTRSARVCALALFASVVAHELAHALVARRFGVRTSAITLFLFGGVATLEVRAAHAGGRALIALAGPARARCSRWRRSVPCSRSSGFARLGDVAASIGLLGTYVVLANARAGRLQPRARLPDGRRARPARAALARAPATGAARDVAARVGIAFALLFVAAGVLVVAATHNSTYGWYASSARSCSARAGAKSAAPGRIRSPPPAASSTSARRRSRRRTT